MASVIISDTHFGLDSSTLNDPAKVDQLMREISEFGNGCDEVVLLGDIFDFWRVRPENAVRDSIYFLKRLSQEDLKIRYVVGNHDHHLVVQKQEDEFMERTARGDLFPVYASQLRWCQTISGLNIDMLYPTYRVSYCHRTVLFTHGHHLDGIQTFTMQLVEKLRRLSGEELLPADLEMMMTYAYESIYRSAYIGEMVSFEDRIWKASNLLQRFTSGVLRKQRYASVEGQYDAILKFIRDQNQGAVDCFIYGDTHRAGIFQRKGGPLAVNAGSFTREQGKGSCMEMPNTYVFLNEGGLALRQLGRSESLYLCELI
jgi:UDP-2,3-diacylglucosamine pyrophosphatase LpxH